MRRLFIICLILFCVQTDFARADILKDILGSWKVSSELYRNGKKISLSIGTARVSRHGKRGLYIVETIPGDDTKHTWLRDSGDYRVKFGSKFVPLSAKWKLVGGKLVINQKYKNLVGSTTVSMVNKKKIISISSYTEWGDTMKNLTTLTRK